MFDRSSPRAVASQPAPPSAVLERPLPSQRDARAQTTAPAAPVLDAPAPPSTQQHGGTLLASRTAPATERCSTPTIETTTERHAEPTTARDSWLYVPVGAKFVAAALLAALWVTFSVLLSRPWVADLHMAVGPVLAWTIVVLVAYLPGGVVAFLSASLVIDRQPALRVSHPTTALTIIVAARDEEAGIGQTLRSLAGAAYDGPVMIILADNGSTDRTAEVARETADELGIDLLVVHEPRPGKSNALNRALLQVTTPYVITVDADTLLHHDALRRLVSRLESAPLDTVAVAGTVLVRNSRANLLTQMQEWDYYLGIAAVKRMQGLYQATLVAQGAFSIYLTEEIRRIGGWPDAIGEDIVVTWRLMESGQRVYFEPTAVAFTDAPSEVRHFMRQRARWARGMLEGLRAVPPWRQRRVLTRFVAGVDLLIPFLDIGYVCVWLPGLVLLVLGNPVLVSVWTLAVLPITLVVYGGLRRFQQRHVFAALDLQVRRNRLGYVAFLLLYQVLCSTASLAGYAQYLAGTRRRWK